MDFDHGRLQRKNGIWPRAFWPLCGFISLLWFLVRVIPKPSRAAYPCQRAAAPWASAFVVWLLAVMGTRWSWRRAVEWSRRVRRGRALAGFAAAGICGAMVVVQWPEAPAQADPPPTHGPLGTGKGIHPGRVVWVHAPDATDWAGFTSPEPWWQSNHTDLATVEAMVSEAVRTVAGQSSDALAWDAMFHHFNATHDRGQRGYLPGERVVIKLNLVTCSARDPGVDPLTYEKKAAVMNRIDNSPQMVLALLRQLVYQAGVRPGCISVGDPTALFPEFMWNMIHPEFPDVHLFDNLGGAGRMRTELSDVPLHWSTTNADRKLPDFIPAPFAEADYLINFALLKGHSAGVTLCGKNLFGALLRYPDGYLRGAGMLDYFNLHTTLPNANWSPGLSHYRAVVDLMGHPRLGGKTLLCLIDGLFGGYYWDAQPRPWHSPPFGSGTNTGWPSSLFASQDPVAIDSVAYDFLLEEWPDVVSGGTGAPGSLQGGAEDYLHEAALAGAPPSGTFYDPRHSGVPLASLGVHEHWDNPVNRLYSRNRGSGEGIELVALRVDRPKPRLALRRSGSETTVTWPAAQTGFHLEFTLDLPPAGPWQTVTSAPVFFQGLNVIRDSAPDGQRFYRLAQ